MKRQLVAMMSPAVRAIINLNVEHYRDLLRTERDEAKRQAFAGLLAEEEAKLAKHKGRGAGFTLATHANE